MNPLWTFRGWHRTNLHEISLLAFLALLIPILGAPSVASAQESISELTVIYGGSSNIQAPPGYTKYPRDLNQGAGGDYIYLCYKKGVGAPVTGLAITFETNLPPAEFVWTRINVDLNRNAGGAYIWLWYTKDPACTTIDDIVVVTRTVDCPAGYDLIPLDLNDGAGGAYLYICYRRI